MDPIHQLALMYAVNTGLGALGGKRGSRLFKDSFKDTAMQAALIKAGGGFQGGQTPPPSTNMNLQQNQLMTQTGQMPQPIVPEGLSVKETMQFEQLPVVDATQSTFSITPEKRKGIGGFFDSVTGVFKSEQPVVGEQGAVTQVVRDASGNVRQIPVTMSQTDNLKIGLGSLGAGAAAYGLGAFDPVKPPEPKYPGYNLFYAQNPGQFMPYDDPDIEIDYSQYPDKPYSGIKAGGIMSLEDGGQVAPDLLKQQYEEYKKEKDSAGEDAMDFETYKIFKMQFPGAKEGGITKLMAGGRATNMPVESIAESTQDEMDMIPPPMSSIMPRQMFMPMMMAKDGALVDKLPSKTNTDENNESNYKRTSGKLVVDAAGKGNEEKDTMLAQLADGEFVTKSKAVRGAGIALGANPNDKKQQRELGARFFYKQMADFDKLAKRMS